jgi:hypothetical protein
VVVRRGVRNAEPDSVVAGRVRIWEADRIGVAVELISGLNVVVEVGGNIEVEVVGRLGVLVVSSPKIAIALRRASSFIPPAGAPDPVVNPDAG